MWSDEDGWKEIELTWDLPSFFIQELSSAVKHTIKLESDCLSYDEKIPVFLSLSD